MLTILPVTTSGKITRAGRGMCIGIKVVGWDWISGVYLFGYPVEIGVGMGVAFSLALGYKYFVYDRLVAKRTISTSETLLLAFHTSNP